jgi:hypothetical protein
MEEVQNTLRANQMKLLAKRDARAMEKFAKHPQLADDNMIAPQDPKGQIGEAGERVGAGREEAALNRLVGAGRKGKASCDMEELEGGSRHGMDFAKTLKAKHGVNAADQFMKGAHGRELMFKLSSVHGAGFAKQFRDAFDSEMVEAPKTDIASKIKVTRRGGAQTGVQGIEVAHAKMDGLVPNAVAPEAYGSAPQAPASFKRNTVGMGKKMAVPEEVPMMEGGAKKMKAKRQPSERNKMISNLMKTKGMTLGEASRWIKEHAK